MSFITKYTKSFLLNGRPTTGQNLPPFSIVLTSTYVFYFLLLCHLFIVLIYLFTPFVVFLCIPFCIYIVNLAFHVLRHHSVDYLFVFLFVFVLHNTSKKYPSICNICFVYGVSNSHNSGVLACHTYILVFICSMYIA
jgi:hypothetical protein